MAITLKAARANKDYRQDFVAKELGVTVTTLSKWENGKSIPDARQFKQLACLYEMSTDDLILPKKSN